jgi:hypothetical protein
MRMYKGWTVEYRDEQEPDEAVKRARGDTQPAGWVAKKDGRIIGPDTYEGVLAEINRRGDDQ